MSENRPQDDVIDIEPQVVSEDKPVSVKRNITRNAGLLAGIALLAALGGGWFYRDILSSYLPNDEVHALSIRIDALEAGNKEATKRIDAVIALTDELKAQLGAARAAADKATKDSVDLLAQSQSNGAAVAEMKQALDQARADLENVKSNLAAGVGATAGGADPALAQRLDVLEKNLAALSGAAPAKVDLAALKQSLSALNSKISDGLPFAGELTVIARDVPAADGLDVLKAEADKGLANAKQLATALGPVIAQLPKRDAPSTSDGWMDRVGNFFAGLITIKSIGSDDWPTVAAKASALVDAGDLQQADALFAGVEGQPPAALATWHELLQRRIKLEDALAKASAAVSREIAAKG